MIKYVGHVNIYENDKLVFENHNTGTLKLSQLFAQALAGKFEVTLCPTYMDLTNVYNYSYLKNKAVITQRHLEKDSELQSTPIPGQKTYESRTENYRAHLEATLSKDMFNFSSVSSTYDKYINLLDASGEVLASSNITEYINSWFPDLNNIDKNIIISWEMELIYDKVDIEELS